MTLRKMLIAAVLAALCFVPISAQAEHVVKVGRGLIFIQGAINPNLFDVSFAGGRFRITQLGVDDFTVTHGLHQCTPCSSSMFVPGVELTQFSPPGSFLINGHSAGWNGGLSFIAGSVTQSFDFLGSLTISGIANLGGFDGDQFVVCQQTDQGCINTGLVFQVIDHGQWKYAAQFAPDPQGNYIFLSLTIASVPEPGPRED